MAVRKAVGRGRVLDNYRFVWTVHAVVLWGFFIPPSGNSMEQPAEVVCKYV